jgi:hypothetical protein
MSRRWVALAVAAIWLTGGCGGNSNDEAGPQPAGVQSGTASPTSPTPATSETAGETGVPDACSLLSSADLSELLGVDQGPGNPQSVSPDRTVCFFEAGTITSVELAANYQASRDIIEADPSRNVTDVSGVGEEAFFDDLGGVAQLVAKGERYFVGVTFVYETPESGIETGKQIVAAMLAAAES